MKIFQATMNTGSFEFSAVAETESNARQMMLTCWKRHCKEYKISSSGFPTVEHLEDYFGINCFELQVGGHYRDGEKI